MRVYFFISLFTVGVFVAIGVHAAPLAPQPSCRVRAEVVNVERTTQDRIVPEPRRFDFYAVKLKVQEVNSQPCAMYLVGSEYDTHYDLNQYEERPIRSGQIIDGVVHAFGDEQYNAIYLRNVKVVTVTSVENQASDIDISDSLFLGVIEKGYVDEIETVTPDSGREGYRVIGHKKARLFAIIPIRMKIRMVIGENSDQVMSLKKPWWAFLARE